MDKGDLAELYTWKGVRCQNQWMKVWGVQDMYTITKYHPTEYSLIIKGERNFTMLYSWKKKKKKDLTLILIMRGKKIRQIPLWNILKNQLPWTPKMSMS